MIRWLVRDAMCALMPAAAGLPGVADTDIDSFLVRFERESAPLLWLGVVAGAVLFALTPILTVYLPAPAFALGPALRDKHAERITRSNVYLLRQGIFVLRLAAGLCWGGHARVRERFAMAPYAPDPGTFRVS